MTSMGGSDKPLDLQRKQQITGMKEMHLLYIFPPELRTQLHFSNFVNSSKKNSYGCAVYHPSAAESPFRKRYFTTAQHSFAVKSRLFCAIFTSICNRH
jgi:hypothetical protein